jgi:cutinase
VVIFGDPNNGTAVTGISAAKTLVVCHTGNSICQHGDQVLKHHITVWPLKLGRAFLRLIG